MREEEPRYFRAPRWLVGLHQFVFCIGLLVLGLGIHFNFQTPWRGDTVPSASRPYRTNPGKGSVVYYLSQADYFYCERLWLIGFMTMLAPCATFYIYGRWVARPSSAPENTT